MPSVISRASPSLMKRLFKFGNREALARLAAIPGPEPALGLGNAAEFLGRTPFEGLERLRDRYGELVSFWLFGKPNLLVNEPHLIEEVLVSREDEFIKNNPRAATVVPIMGESLFTSRGGNDCARKRDLHPFSREGIEGWYDQCLPELCALTLKHLEPADNGAIFSLLPVMMATSFQAFSTSLLGMKLPESYNDTFDRLMVEVSRRGLVPVSPSPGFWRERERWFGMIAARIREVRSNPNMSQHSLLGHVFLKGWMTFGEDLLRDEISTTFGAGSRNVAITSSILLYLLSQHPQLLEAIREEAQAVHKGHPERLTWKELKGLSLLHRSYQETLRLYPVVPGFVRESDPERDVFLDGHLLPQGTQIFIAPWTLHHRGDLWADPLRFDPDRFLKPPDPLHYIPFGLGRRVCIGEDYTALCVKAITLTAIRHFDIMPRGQGPLKLGSMAATLFPEDGVPSTLRRRT